MVSLPDDVVDGRASHLVAAAELVAGVIDRHPSALDMALKWGRATYAIEGDFHHWLCQIGITKKAE